MIIIHTKNGIITIFDDNNSIERKNWHQCSALMPIVYEFSI